MPLGSEFLPVLDCNMCGNCCRQGGECVLRKRVNAPVNFEGDCEFLGEGNECLAAKTLPLVIHQMLFKGKCNFPDLRIEDVGSS